MTTTGRITSYTDYLLALTAGWPELDELHDFMRSRPQSRQSSLMIIELTKVDTIQVQRFSNRDIQWRNALHERKDSARARVCVLEYSDAELIDREMLDSCALLYDLDPFFILGHFASTKIDEDEFPRSRLAPVHIPSRQTVYRFAKTSLCFIDTSVAGLQYDFEVFILHMPSGTTVYTLPHFVVSDLERPSIHNEASFRKNLSGGSIMQCYMARLRSWTRAEIDSAYAEPIFILLPWLEFFALEQKNQVLNNVEDWNGEKKRLPFRDVEQFNFRSEVFGYALYRCEETIYTAIKNMEVWRRQLNIDTNFYTQLGLIIEDLQDTHALIRRGIDDLEIVKNDYGRTRALTDSRNAAARSQDSAALTTMAFFFIPISVVTSIFGMNVQELGSGSLPIWQAFMSTGVAIVVAILLWGISGTVSRRWSSFAERVKAFQQFNRHWRRFARVRPMLGFWLFIFFLTHNPTISELGLKYCGLDMFDEWHVPQLISEDIREYRNRLSPFWEDKLMKVCDVTRVQGWDK